MASHLLLEKTIKYWHVIFFHFRKELVSITKNFSRHFCFNDVPVDLDAMADVKAWPSSCLDFDAAHVLNSHSGFLCILQQAIVIRHRSDKKAAIPHTKIMALTNKKSCLFCNHWGWILGSSEGIVSVCWLVGDMAEPRPINWPAAAEGCCAVVP